MNLMKKNPLVLSIFFGATMALNASGCSVASDVIPEWDGYVGEAEQALSCQDRCDHGWDYWGNPIPKNATTGGFSVCGLENQSFTCDTSNWTAGALGCSGSAPLYNTKFGVNSAIQFDASCALETKAAGMGMGYYLEIAYQPSELNAVVQSMQCAIQNRIIPILRICDSSNPCGFTDVNTYVAFLQQLSAQVGDSFYAVAGPNEPLTEKWIPGTENIVWNGGYTQQQLSTLGQKNAQYMNAVIAGVGNVSNIGLLSPVFNCTDGANSDFVYWMHQHGANFSALDGIAGNAYNVNTSQGLTVLKYVNDCQYAFSSQNISAPSAFYLTEMGAWESQLNHNSGSPQIPHAQALANLKTQVDAMRVNSNIRAALFFNGFDTNGDADFDYGALSDADFSWILGGGVSLPQPSCTKITVQEDFETMPLWSSTFDALWGSVATWQIPPSGQSGNYLNAIRDGEGSSAKVRVYPISPNTDYTISVYMKGAARPSVDYWVESSYKLGTHNAQDFDQNAGTWTRIRKFTNTTLDGNGNVWTRYKKTFNSGNSTQISVGFKSGSQGGIAPAARWDTLRIE